MLDYLTLARLIQDDRRREIEAAARARMLQQADRPYGRAVGGPRRELGRMIVRFGIWLAMLETTNS